MTEFLTTVADAFGPTLLAAAMLFAFAESALGVGALVPGEAVILALGAAATTPQQMLCLLAAVAVGASAGDHAGYMLGRNRSTTIRSSRPVSRIGVHHWDRAAVLVRRQASFALIVSRLLPVVRTLTPAVAGASAVTYRMFLVGSAIGSTLWAGLWVAAAGAGSSMITHVGRQLGPLGVVGSVLTAGFIAALLVLQRRRRPTTKRFADSLPRKEHR